MSEGAYVEERVTRLEENVTSLTRDVAELSTNVRSMSGVLSKVADSVDSLRLASERNKPLSYGGILTAVIGTGTIFAMVTSGISFLIDARVGAATQRSNTFVQEMTDGGKVYVQLEGLRLRLSRIEEAISWKPQFIDTDKSTRH